LQRNLMFNKSVYIDGLGNVKRHREDEEMYGNIVSADLVEIIENKSFNFFWEVTKDQIEVCKDCEFRYICPDGRIPFKTNSKDEYYKYKTTCKYDPYQGNWDI
jgi:radical SAM protein with 4Fe4S-binding SPASM domain